MTSIIKFIQYSFYLLIFATVQDIVGMDTVEKQWFEFIRLGHLETVKQLCCNVDINARDKNKSTALIIASSYGYTNIVNFLLQNPAINVNAQNKRGETALILASKSYKDIVNLLVQHPEINLNIQDEYGNTALIAAASNEEAIVPILLQAGGLISKHSAAAQSGLGKITIDVNLHDNDGWTALIWAAYYNYDNALKLLMQHADVNAQDIKGRTALMNVASAANRMFVPNYPNTIRLLLQNPRVKINVQSHKGSTALHMAAGCGNHIMIKFLLQMPGIEVNNQNKDLQTALTLATRCGCEESVKLLLKVPGINLNTKNAIGISALWYASQSRNSNILKLLLEFPDIDLHNISWATLEDDHSNLINDKVYELTQKALNALIHNDLDTVKSIAKRVWLYNEIDDQGNTLLHKACAFNAIEIAIFLLQTDSDPREFLLTKNKQGLLPFELISPSSPFFELVLNLAYSIEQPTKIKQCTHKLRSFASDPACAYGAKASKGMPRVPSLFEIPHGPKVLTDLRERGCKVSSDTLIGKICAYCSQEATHFCSTCKAVYYCSQVCQKADWKNHKQSCKQYIRGEA